MLYTEKRREYGKHWRAANREKLRAMLKLYYEAHREQAKEDARRWRKANPGYTRRWRKANPDYARRWYAANREKQVLAQRKWRAANPEKYAATQAKHRALKRGAAIGRVNYRAIVERDRMRCGICGKRVAKRDLCFDHIVPLSRSGAHAEWNIQVAHATCNQRKFLGKLPSQTRLPF